MAGFTRGGNETERKGLNAMMISRSTTRGMAGGGYGLGFLAESDIKAGLRAKSGGEPAGFGWWAQWFREVTGEAPPDVKDEWGNVATLDEWWSAAFPGGYGGAVVTGGVGVPVTSYPEVVGGGGWQQVIPQPHIDPGAMPAGGIAYSTLNPLTSAQLAAAREAEHEVWLTNQQQLADSWIGTQICRQSVMGSSVESTCVQIGIPLDSILKIADVRQKIATVYSPSTKTTYHGKMIGDTPVITQVKDAEPITQQATTQEPADDGDTAAVVEPSDWSGSVMWLGIAAAGLFLLTRNK